MRKAVQGGVLVSCFLIAHRIIQFTCTADQANTLGGVVRVACVSVRKICAMSTLKHSCMTLKACLMKLHS